MSYSVVEICAGAGGQALGLEMAGFECEGAIEIDPHACATLRLNRPHWKIFEADVKAIDGRMFQGVDLLAGGVPCPPFSVAGKQLGPEDERDLFPEALRLAKEIQPAAIMLENVQGFASEKFRFYREAFLASLQKLGYQTEMAILNACNFDVPQLRPRCVIIGIRGRAWEYFEMPVGHLTTKTVGSELLSLMDSNGWKGAAAWAKKAGRIAPTLVGGSKKHGGPDLGPTRAKKQWMELGVDPMGIADQAPAQDFPKDGCPKLTTDMAARLQSFPSDWRFAGRKTAAYRQIGNAFPPNVACAVGVQLLHALKQDVYAAPQSAMAKLCESRKPLSKKAIYEKD